MSYNSSIIQKYGKPETVKTDVVIINEILAQQGISLVLDVVAEYVGQTVLKYKIPSNERASLVENLTKELREAILERV